MKRSCSILILLLAATSCFAQSALTMERFLPQLEKKYGIVFSYDSDLLKGAPVQADTSGKNLSQLLKELNAFSAFHFEAIGGGSILVKPRSANGNFVLCGRVTEKNSGEPLTGALVYQTKGAYALSADENGAFFKFIRFSETDSVTVSTVGYHSVTIPLARFIAKPCTEIRLENIFSEMKEVFVTAYLTQGISYDAADNSISIRPKNLGILPGQTNGDVLLSLDALPGINTPDTKAGNLNIRGSTPDQTLLVFDNIPIYHKGHYFGTLSPFNSRVVDNIKVQRSAMSANSGGRAGGLIEISSASSVANKFQGSVSTSLLDANIYLHAPIKKNKLSFLVSARQSYPYNINSPAFGPLSDFVFQQTMVDAVIDGVDQQQLKSLRFNYRDANAKLIFNLSEKHKASLSFLYLDNIMTLSFQDKTGRLRYDTVSLSNWGADLTLQSKWSPVFSSRFSVTNSFFSQDFRYTRLLNQQNAGSSRSINTAGDFRIFLEADWKLHEKYFLKSGYDMRHHDMWYDKEINDTASLYDPLQVKGTGYLHTVFVNVLGHPSEKFLFNAGVRMNYFDVSGRFSAEPRLSMGYKFNDRFRLKTSGGYQRQFVTQVSGVGVESIGGIEHLLWMLADEKVMPVVNSYQAAFGGMYEKKSWLIDIEAYYKLTNNVTYVSITHPERPAPFIHGSIETIGADLLVRKQWKKVDAWMSYTLSRSMMQFDSVQADPFYSLYDQTHVLDLACSYKTGQWKFSVSWKYRTGLAALPEIRTKMLAGARSGEQQQQQQQPPPPPPGTSPPPQAGDPLYTDRFPDYHQLDASVSFSFPRTPEKWNGSIGLSALNCYNRKNIIGQVPQDVNGQKMMHNRYSLGFMPNVILTFGW